MAGTSPLPSEPFTEFYIWAIGIYFCSFLYVILMFHVQSYFMFTIPYDSENINLNFVELFLLPDLSLSPTSSFTCVCFGFCPSYRRLSLVMCSYLRLMCEE